jgi:hypothetical protein
MSRPNPGIRITIDGLCNTGKTILMQAFAETLRKAGVAEANIVQLNDNSLESRPTGDAAIELLHRFVEGTASVNDTQFVFVERMAPKSGLFEVGFDEDTNSSWRAMPNLKDHPLPDTPCFSLPRSQVAFEMTNRKPPSEEAQALLELHQVSCGMEKAQLVSEDEMVRIHPAEYEMLVRLNELLEIRLRRDVLLTRPTAQQRIDAQLAMTQPWNTESTTFAMRRGLKERRLRMSMQSMLGFADAMAGVKNGEVKTIEDMRARLAQNVPGFQPAPNDISLEQWMAACGLHFEFAKRTERTIRVITIPEDVRCKPEEYVAFLTGFIEKFGDGLLDIFRLKNLTDVSNNPEEQQRQNNLRRDFINRGTDREWHDVKFVADFRPIDGVRGADKYTGALIEAIHEYRPDVLAFVKFQNASLSGSHANPDQPLKFSAVDSHSEFASEEEQRQMTEGRDGWFRPLYNLNTHADRPHQTQSSPIFNGEALRSMTEAAREASRPLIAWITSVCDPDAVAMPDLDKGCSKLLQIGEPTPPVMTPADPEFKAAMDKQQCWPRGQRPHLIHIDDSPFVPGSTGAVLKFDLPNDVTEDVIVKSLKDLGYNPEVLKVNRGETRSEVFIAFSLAVGGDDIAQKPVFASMGAKILNPDPSKSYPSTITDESMQAPIGHPTESFEPVQRSPELQPILDEADRVIRLNAEESERFNNLRDNPPEANAALKAAKARFQASNLGTVADVGNGKAVLPPTDE